MASQGERVPGVDIDVMLGEPMVQDRIPMQDIPEQDESLPQTDPEPEMGAAVQGCVSHHQWGDSNLKSQHNVQPAHGPLGAGFLRAVMLRVSLKLATCDWTVPLGQPCATTESDSLAYLRPCKIP